MDAVESSGGPGGEINIFKTERRNPDRHNYQDFKRYVVPKILQGSSVAKSNRSSPAELVVLLGDAIQGGETLGDGIQRGLAA